MVGVTLKCIIPTKSFVPTHHEYLLTKECHLVSIKFVSFQFGCLKVVFFQFGCHDNHENSVIVFPICLTDCVKSFITLVSVITET